MKHACMHADQEAAAHWVLHAVAQLQEFEAQEGLCSALLILRYHCMSTSRPVCKPVVGNVPCLLLKQACHAMP